MQTEGGPDSDKELLLGSESAASGTRVYKRRFYVLLLAATVPLLNGWIFVTWSPIQSPAKLVFGWTDQTIELMVNWSPIAYVLTIPFFTWLLDTKGLRPAFVLSALFLALGSGIRCISMQPTAATWLNHVGMIFNGLASPVALAAPTIVSATWFPPEQRTVATAVTALAQVYGVAIPFAVGPALVPYDNLTATANKTATIARLKTDIFRMELIEFGCCALALVLICIYFPSKPPVPPSKTAGLERVGFFSGIRKLLREWHFWLIAVGAGISLGTSCGWSGVLDVNLKEFDISQREAGWMGFYSNIAGSVLGFAVSMIVDRILGVMKPILCVLLTGGALCFTWFTLLCFKILPHSTASLYVSAILGGTLITGSVPLFYELSVETTYPIAEGATTGTLALLNNIGCLFYLLISLIPGIGTKWMNPTMAATSLVAVILLLLARVKYGRLRVDLDTNKPIIN
ncbi:solute carrier family 49 member 4 homolog [Oscarella lobularis]|uniref:solute carrier family 49 member 4 homolog n=1 Tax=Oscarella lobularis TaxID=121494 RepID=UPI0033141A0D